MAKSKVRDIVRALEKDGWRLDRQKGSQIHWGTAWWPVFCVRAVAGGGPRVKYLVIFDSLRSHGEPVPPPSAVEADFIEAA